MKNIIQDVRAFHEAFGIPIVDKPAIPSDGRCQLRIDLIKEEVKETISAIENNDLVEIADGLADIIYVTVGAALEFGVPLDRVWDEVQRSNMAKVGGGVREDGKMLKPEGWTPPDIAKALEGETGHVGNR